ncbi:MAG TPA: hypothetical protein EYN06_07640 [Myxococcales bacterium]|nr:hypothetical protein [Myxococcales bacterium]HIN86337.1 hypothetical protein [Myxococcales bacterium]
MAFDWMDAERPPINPQARLDQYTRAIHDRALLLFNLKYSQQRTTKRIQADLNWEFDHSIRSTPRPSFYKDVAKIVASVYGPSAEQPKNKKPATKVPAKAKRKSPKRGKK